MVFEIGDRNMTVRMCMGVHAFLWHVGARARAFVTGSRECAARCKAALGVCSGMCYIERIG